MLQQTVTDQNYSHRTQISLSSSMYQKLMAEKGDKSLAESIRQMITYYWKQQNTKSSLKSDALQKLKKGLSGKPPSVSSILVWENELRSDRL